MKENPSEGKRMIDELRTELFFIAQILGAIHAGDKQKDLRRCRCKQKPGESLSATMNVRYVDAHCHIQFEQYAEDDIELIEQMKRKGVAGIVVGVDLGIIKEGNRTRREI